MDTKQPKWKIVTNLGDINPLDYGGYFVYRDTTGVYPPEACLLEVYEDEGKDKYIVYRFVLDPLKIVEENNHIYLVPAKYEETWPYPVHSYDEWFHKDLDKVASFISMPVSELRQLFCSNNPIDLAEAYRSLGQYFGFENLDSYPEKFSSRGEVSRIFKKEIRFCKNEVKKELGNGN